MRQQYGLRIQGDEFKTMGWDEFADLLNGLNDTTPLVQIVRIRTESDREALKHFTKEQRRIRSEWQRRAALKKSQGETATFPICRRHSRVCLAVNNDKERRCSTTRPNG